MFTKASHSEGTTTYGYMDLFFTGNILYVHNFNKSYIEYDRNCFDVVVEITIGTSSMF